MWRKIETFIKAAKKKKKKMLQVQEEKKSLRLQSM